MICSGSAQVGLRPGLPGLLSHTAQHISACRSVDPKRRSGCEMGAAESANSTRSLLPAGGPSISPACGRAGTRLVRNRGGGDAQMTGGACRRAGRGNQDGSKLSSNRVGDLNAMIVIGWRATFRPCRRWSIGKRLRTREPETTWLRRPRIVEIARYRSLPAAERAIHDLRRDARDP